MKFKILHLQSVNNPNSIHGIYPYRGKISALDAEQILAQMPRGSVVLDPFCGSGTIVYEGLKYGLRTIGIDANPIAVTLSKGKINVPHDLTEVQEELDRIIANCKKGDIAVTLPEYPKSLFHEQSLVEIMNVAAKYEEMSDYLKACFLGAVALTARGCNQYKWTSSTVGKNIFPKRYIDFYDKLRAKIKKHHYPIANNSKIYYADSRTAAEFIPANSIDFIFTSPPYFDCLDYTAYYAKIIYDILGQDRIAIKNRLIQQFDSYAENMRMVLDNLYKILKPGGQVIFVVGNKKIHKKVINGAEYFKDISPFEKYNIIERSYTGTSSQVFDKLNKTDRKEQVIIWEK